MPTSARCAKTQEIPGRALLKQLKQQATLTLITPGGAVNHSTGESATNGAVEVRIVAVGLVGAEIVPLGDLGADVDDDGTWLGV